MNKKVCRLQSSNAPTLQRSIWCLGIIIICVIMKQVEMNQNSRLTPHLALPSEAALSHLSELNGLRLSPHFKLGELCKTKYVTADGNIPSRAVIENLIRVCGWLEELRVVAGVRPRSKVWCAVVAGVRPQSKVAGDCTLAPDPRAAPRPGAAPRPEGCAKTRGRRQSWGGLRGALAVRGYSRGNWRNFAFWLLSKDKNVKNG